MKERRRTEIKVGGLVTVSLIAVFVFIWLLGDFSISPANRIHVDFSHTGGLKTGAAVTLSGVTIGKITDVDLVRIRSAHRNGDSKPGGALKRPQVRVTAEIPTRQFKAVPSDVTASVGARSVLGEKHLELTPGPGGGAPLADGTVLQGLPPAGIEKAGGDAVAMMKRLTQFMDRNEDNLTVTIGELRELATGANDFLKENRTRLDEAIKNLNSTSKNLAEQLGPRGRLTSSMAKVDRVMRRIDGATQEIDSDIPGLINDVNALTAKADRLVTNMDRLVVDMTDPTVGAVKHINDIAGGIDKGRGTVGQLVADRTLYDDIVEFIKDLKARPWRLLWKK